MEMTTGLPRRRRGRPTVQIVDEPRPGAPRTITDEDVERVVVKTLEETPTDATRWSTRAMARATGMPQTTVRRIWRAFGLEPHVVDTFKRSEDPQFIEKVRDVAGLCLNPRTWWSAGSPS